MPKDNEPQLLTSWIRIASEGFTADGREIGRQAIIEMAETYNPQEYAALIWPEHYRYFGNYGKIWELKAEEAEEKMRLFARIIPNSNLLLANEKGQKLFSSIEPVPNFANTGKWYLYGMAVTDSPASLGTTAMQFRAGNNNTICGAPEHFIIDEVAEFKQGEKRGRFKRLFNLGAPAPQPELNTAMDKEQFAQLMQAQEQQFQLLTTISQQFTKQPEPAKPEPAAPPQEKEAPAVTGDQFKQLSEQFEKFSTENTALRDELKTLRDEFNIVRDTSVTNKPDAAPNDGYASKLV